MIYVYKIEWRTAQINIYRVGNLYFEFDEIDKMITCRCDAQFIAIYHTIPYYSILYIYCACVCIIQSKAVQYIHRLNRI